jgi:hypothetical protein
MQECRSVSIHDSLYRIFFEVIQYIFCEDEPTLFPEKLNKNHTKNLITVKYILPALMLITAFEEIAFFQGPQ